MITGNQHIKRDWNWLQSEVLCFYRNSCLKTTTEEPFLQRNCTIDVKFCWCQIEAFPLTLVSSWSISTFPLLQLKQDGKESRFSLWLRLVVCHPACIDTWTQQGLQPPDLGRRLHVWWECCWFWVQNSQLMVLLCFQFLHSVPLIHSSSMQVVFSHHGYIDILHVLQNYSSTKQFWMF